MKIHNFFQQKNPNYIYTTELPKLQMFKIKKSTLELKIVCDSQGHWEKYTNKNVVTLVLFLTEVDNFHCLNVRQWKFDHHNSKPIYSDIYILLDEPHYIFWAIIWPPRGLYSQSITQAAPGGFSLYVAMSVLDLWQGNMSQPP